MTSPPSDREINPAESIVVPLVPVEMALVTAAMALVLIAMPIPAGPVSHLNDLMLLGFSGFMLFFVAKISLFGRGIWASWGPAPMRPPFKLSYICGYSMMTIASVGLVSLSF